MDDGSFLAAEYLVPVHYQNEAGEWVDYDHSLEITDTSSQFSPQQAPALGGETPAQSITKPIRLLIQTRPFALSESSVPGSTAQIENKGYTLAWGPEESQESELEIVRK